MSYQNSRIAIKQREDNTPAVVIDAKIALETSAAVHSGRIAMYNTTLLMGAIGGGTESKNVDYQGVLALEHVPVPETVEITGDSVINQPQEVPVNEVNQKYLPNPEPKTPPASDPFSYNEAFLAPN